MRSRASFRGHPIHPALIPFPFAFLYGAFLFDLAGKLTDHPGWWRTGGHLGIIGIAAALVAAIPGFIDYFGTVPPRSSGKQRATKHMLVNLGAVALFIVACVIRGQPGAMPGTLRSGYERSSSNPSIRSPSTGVQCGVAAGQSGFGPDRLPGVCR